MQLDVEIKLNKAMIEKLKRGLPAIERHILDGLDAVGQYAASEARKEAPIDTGRLRRSITHEVEGKDQVNIGTNIIYARIQEYGGEIRPKQKKVLAWIERPEGSKGRFAPRPATPEEWRKARKEGKARYAKRVRLKGKGYFKKAIEAVKASPKPKQILKRALKNALLDIGLKE